jgi:ketosteroid isomerase-like protein
MSEENVERLRAMYEAFNRRDWDALFRHTDLEFAFTYRNPGRTPDAGTRKGREAVVAFAEEYGGAFDRLIWEPEEFFDHEDRVVAFVSVRMRPPGGALDLVVPNGHLWTIHGGVVLSLESFPERQSALEAAGLSE